MTDYLKSLILGGFLPIKKGEILKFSKNGLRFQHQHVKGGIVEGD